MVGLLLFVLGVLVVNIFFLIEAIRYGGKKSFFLSGISVIPIIIANALWLIAATPEERGRLVYLVITLSILFVQVIAMLLYNTTIIAYSGLGGKKTYWYLLPGLIYGVFIHSIRWSGFSASGWSTFATIEIIIFWLTFSYIAIGVIYNITMLKKKNRI